MNYEKTKTKENLNVNNAFYIRFTSYRKHLKFFYYQACKK